MHTYHCPFSSDRHPVLLLLLLSLLFYFKHQLNLGLSVQWKITSVFLKGWNLMIPNAQFSQSGKEFLKHVAPSEYVRTGNWHCFPGTKWYWIHFLYCQIIELQLYLQSLNTNSLSLSTSLTPYFTIPNT